MGRGFAHDPIGAPVRSRCGGTPAVFTIGSTHLARQAGLGDPEIMGDVRDPDTRLTTPGQPHDLVAELLRIRLRNGNVPFNGAFQHYTSDVTATRCSPFV